MTNTIPDNHKIILITGGIGSGKSVVSRILRLKGFDVFDTDAHAKMLMNTSPAIRMAIIERWGSGAYDNGSTLNSSFVAEIIFNEPDQRLWLNAIVHNAVIEDLRQIASATSTGISFVECAIPATSQIFRTINHTWLIEAPLKTRIERVVRRNNLSEQHIVKRISTQDKEYVNIPTPLTVITNDNNTPLLPQIEYSLKNLS